MTYIVSGGVLNCTHSLLSCKCNVFTFNTAQHYHCNTAHEPTSGSQDGGRWAPGAQPHTARPSLVTGV